MPRFAQIEPTISRLLSHPSRGGILDTDSIAPRRLSSSDLISIQPPHSVPSSRMRLTAMMRLMIE